MNTIYLFAWVPIVHRALVPGLHMRWVLQHVLPVVLGAAAPAVMMVLVPSLMPVGLSRWSGALAAVAFLSLSLVGAAAGSSILRNRAGLLIRRRAAA